MKRRKLLLETLEERILCSVTAPQPDVAPTATHAMADTAAAHPTATHAAAAAPELIVANASLPEVDALIAQLAASRPDRTFTVLKLDSFQDGIAQISAALAASGQQFDAIHLLGHGRAGEITLGSTQLQLSNLDAYSAQIAGWKPALTAGADVLFYGCDVASSAAGRALVAQVGALSGADVAASTDATGAAALGGNWTLEYAQGSVTETLGAAVNGAPVWSHLMGGTPINGGIGSFAGVYGNKIYSISFDTGKATLVGTSKYVAASGTLNSLGIDSVNGIVYYADSANGSKAIYGFDLHNGQQFIVAADVTTFGVTLPAGGLGAAGGDFAGGAYYFSTEGGGPNGRDQIYKLTLAAGSNGRTAQSIAIVDYIDGATEFGDFVVVPGATTKLYSFNSAVGVDEYNLTATPQNLTYVQRDANTNVRQAAMDRNGVLYAVGTNLRSYNPAGAGTFGSALNITTDGTTALTDSGGLADGSSYIPAESSIGDTIWYDANLNGVQDGGESGVAGLTVSLYDDLNGNGALDAGERLLATTTTGANGAYAFGQLLPGDYLISVSDPTNILLGGTSTTGGTLQAASITAVGQAITTKDFGFEKAATVTVSSPAVTEGTDPYAIFTVSLSNPVKAAVTFNLSLAAGSATGGGTDFGPTLEVSTNGGATWVAGTTATIAAGSTSVLVRTPITNDALNEAAETFNFTATKTSGLTANAGATGTATITDNDPQPALTINDVTVNEAAGTATFTVNLNAASGLPVTVNYATANNTATAGADFTAKSGTLSFAAGVTSQTITVAIANDTTYEGSESFFLNLSGATNATIADAQGVGTINDDGTGPGGTDNDTPTLAINNVAVTEGTDPYAIFTLSLSNASTTPVTVNLTTSDGSASGAGVDYGAAGSANLQVSTDGGVNWVSGSSATFAAGSTSLLVRTKVVDDLLNEPTENFTLTATRTAGTATNTTVVGTATITDDDATPSLTINDVTVNEAAGTATFTVTLSAASGRAISVNYATSNATATAGSDYTAKSGTLNFGAGTTTQTITVPILNDAIFEGSEAFNVTLTAAVNATIADNLGVGTITDDGTGIGGADDDRPTISVSSPTVTEGTNPYAIFTVSLSNASTTAITGNLTLTGQTATGGGVDFGPALEVSIDGGNTWGSTTMGTLSPGLTTILVRTPIVDDAIAEPAETFTLTATRTAGVTTNASAAGTATINDNDPTPALAVNDLTVNEAAGTATFTVSLSGASGSIVTVNYATSNGTATAGTDYGSASGALTFAPGVTRQTVTVPIFNDAIFENSETFFLTLASASNATIADNIGVATIRDDGTGAGGTNDDTPALNVSNVTVSEGSGYAVFAVGLSNPSTTGVAVSLALANGTATGAGTDFGPTLEVSTDGGAHWTATNAATIAAGTTNVLVRTPITDDTLSEAAETFTLTATRTGGLTTNTSAVGTATINDNDGLPGLTINDVTVNEAAGTATFTVALSAVSAQTVTVNYGTSDGTATAGADYAAVAGGLSFAPGVTSQTITVPITNDTTFEGGETFNVVLSGAINAAIVDASGLGTIADDGTGLGGTDNDTPTLSVSSPTVTEGANAFAVFTVSLSNAATTAVAVNLALATGTASGADFGPALEVSTDGGANWVTANSATIAAGTTSVLVRTPVIDDGITEATETFTLTATRSSGPTVNASAVGTASIQDNDLPGTLSINDVTVNEGAGTATFTVTLSSPNASTVTVNYATADGTALAGADFIGKSGGLSFAPGVTSQTVTVSIVNDAVYEGSETFNVLLSGATNATIADAAGLGTIKDDGTGGGAVDNDTPTLTVSSPAVTEGTDAYAIFTVALSTSSTTAVSANLALANGSATGGGTDFGPGLEVSLNGGATWNAASSVTIPAGSTSALVRTPIVNDALNEAAETFTLTASRTAGATTNAVASSTATIADNDATPSLTINDVSVNEGAGTATFTVLLNTASGQVVTVDFATSDGTATAGSDYTARAGTLTFAAGVTSQTITVPITNDTPYEGAETFRVTLSNAVNATIADGIGIGTILDDGTGSGGTNDDRPVNSLPANFAATEDTPRVLGGISITGPDVTAVVTVTFQVTNGTLNLSTAVGGGVTAGQVSGNGSGTVTITARMDAINATLANAAGLTFTATADFNGAATLSMTTVNGIGSDTDAVTITVAPVADIANDTAATNEDTPVTISVLANDSFENGGRTITAVDGHAITAGGAPVTVNAGTVALNVAGQLIYTPTANYNGATSFTYTVTSGGVTETANVAVSIASVNDPLAVSSPNSGSATEDTPYVFSTANGNALTIEDVDGGQLEVTLAVTHGTLTLGGTAGLTFTTGDGTSDAAMIFRGTAVQLSTAMQGLTFTPSADYNGAAPLFFNVRDVGKPVLSLINGGFEQPGGIVNAQVDAGTVPGWDTSASDNKIEIWGTGFNGVGSYEGTQFAEINATQSSTLSQTISVPTGSTLTYSFAHRGRAGVDVMKVKLLDLGANGVLGGGDDTTLLDENFSDGILGWGAYTRSVGTATGNPLLLEFTSVSTATGDPTIGNFVDGVSLIAEQNIPQTITINVAPVADIADDTATTAEDTPVTIPVLANDTFEDPTAAITAVDGQAIIAGGAAVPVSHGTVALNSSKQLIFTPTANYNGGALFSYTVSAGGGTETANVNVTVTPVNDPPTIDLNGPAAGTGYATSFTENGSATAVIGANVTLADLDNTTLASAKLVLTNAQASDALAIFGSLPAGISGAIDTSVAGQITVNLTGSAPLASYQAALQQIQFSNSSDAPSTVTRNVSVTVNDGAADSNAAVSLISVVAVNDAPGVSLPGALNVTPGVPTVIAGVSFSDVDAGSSAVTVTLSVTGGALTVASAVPGGLTAGQITGNGSAAVTLTGSLAAINTTLANASGLTFSSNTSGGYTLTAAINDGGNTGVDPSTLGLPATGSATDERGSGTMAVTVTPPTLTVANVAVTEGTDAYAIFTVALSNPSSGNVTLNLATGTGTAIGGGVDFGPGLEVSTNGGASWVTASTATIAAGSTSVLVRTPIVNDTLKEAAETFTFTATVTGGTVSNQSTTSVATITDNDPTPSLTINDVTVNEGAGTATFTVTLSAASGQVVTVDYATAAGTATSGADFGATNGTLNFAAGVTTQTITVPIVNDAVYEGSESYSVLLSAVVNATLADGTGAGTILDDGTGSGGVDNDKPSLSVSNVTVAEGTDPHAIFTVSLSNASTTPVSVSLMLANGLATGGGVDFGPTLEVSTDGGGTWTTTANATFVPGSTSVLVRTPIVDDFINEAAEDFSLTATRIAGTTTNASALGLATINDNDAVPALTITGTTVNEKAGTATFTVTLSAASEQTVTVDYATSDGTATAGADYLASVGTLKFLAGVTTQTITVPILDDALFEGSENFTVTLANTNNATILGGSALGTILDDGTGSGGTDNDKPSLSVSNTSATEGLNPYGIFSVALSNPSTTAVTVSLATTGGSATSGADFSPALEVSSDGGTNWTAAASYTFTPGNTVVLVRTAVVDDALNEDIENFTLTASVTAGTTKNAAASGVGTIFDNDGVPAFSINDVTVNEGAGTATFTVTLSAASGQNVSVDYATANFTALAGSDFTTKTGTLNFAAGVTSQTITVAIVNDSVYEGSEAFLMVLSNATNAGIADDTGIGTILDDGTGSGGTDNDKPTLSIKNVSVAEGTDAYAVFTITLSNASAAPIDVAIATANGTALGGGVDFGALEVSTDGGTNWTAAASATFAPGVTSLLVRTPITDDAVTEVTEHFTLSAAVTAGVTTNANATATGTIFDNDTQPLLSIADVLVNESAGTATFTVELAGTSSLPVTVNYATTPGTAGTNDFTAKSGVLTFAPGVTSQTITIAITNDTLFENTESFQVVLSGAVNAGISDGIATGQIVDDDVRQAALTVIGTSEVATLGNQVVPGEVVTYELKLELAEGVNPLVTLHDLLPTGLRFLPNAPIVIGYQGVSSSITGFTAGTYTNGTADAAISGSLTANVDTYPDGSDVFFKLGTLTNNDADADREFVTVRFQAVTSNVASNRAGVALDNRFAALIDTDNSGTPGYVSLDRDGDNLATGSEIAADPLNDGSGTAGLANTATMQVAEPVLSVTKQIITLPAKLLPGAELAYQLTISHAPGSGGTAWETTLADSLPVGLLLSQIDSVTLAGGAQQQVAAGIGGLGTVLNGVWDIPVGGSVTVVYRAAVTQLALLGSSLNTVADVSWSSIDGPNADERTGADSLFTGGGLNNYRLATSKAATVDTGVDAFSLVKQIIGDNKAEIGERLTYQLTLKVADGTIDGISLNDLIPPGFQLVNGSATLTPGAGVTVSGAAFSYAANQLTLNLAQVESAVDGAENTLTITYAVDVLDVPANDTFGGVGAAVKTNTATASYDPGSGALTVQDSATVQVVEPVIVASETVVSAPAKPNAGDTITFKVVISHDATSTGNAYHVVYGDTLPAALGAVTLTGVTGSAANLPALSDFSVTGNSIATVNPFDLALGENVVLTYTAVVRDTVLPGEIITNDALVTAQSTELSPSGNIRNNASATNGGNYDATSAATLTADSTFKVTAKANVTTANVGDRVHYTITVDVIEGTTPGLVLTDLLPSGMPVDPASIQIAYGSAGMTSSQANPASLGGGALTLDFGTLTNAGDNDPSNDRITITFDEVVTNTPANNRGDVKTNAVSGTYTGLGTPEISSPSLTIAEPVLKVQASVNDSTPHLGQTVTYTLTISHDPTSTAAGFDLALNDLLPAGLSLNAASIQLVNPPGATAITSNTSVDGGALQLTLNQLALGDTATITFTAKVTTDPAVIGGTFGGGDDDLSSAIGLGFDSQAGANPEQRTGADSTTETLTVVGADLAVTIDDGQATANAGGRVTYTITVKNNGTDTATNVLLANTLPPIGGVFNAGLSSAGGTLVNGKVNYTIPALAAGATTTLTVVLDLSTPTAAGLEAITSSVTATHDDIEPTVADNSAADTDMLTSRPDYQITVTDNRSSAKPGETVDYVITVKNAGDQDGTGIVIGDQFTTGIYAALTADHGGIVDLNTGTVTWNVAALGAGETLSLHLHGTLLSSFANIPIPVGTPAGGVPDNNAIVHTVNVHDDGLGGAEPTPADNVAADADDLQPVPELRITQSDRTTMVKGGQVVTYRITATNSGSQAAIGVVVTDVLPPGVTFMKATSADGALTGTAEVRHGKVIWRFTGDLPAGSSVVLTVTMRVNADVAPGTPLTNRVRITDSGIYGPDVFNRHDNAASDTNLTPDVPVRPISRAEIPPVVTPQWFAFDRFNNFAQRANPTAALPGMFSPESAIDTSAAPLLPLMPIYSGSADPGATLIISIYNSRGEQIGAQTVIADTGGNWLATFASSNTRDVPNSVEITQLAAPINASESWGHNLRTNYSPALNPGQFFFQTLQGSSIGDEEAPLLGGLGLENPLELGAVKYGGELLGAGASASGY